MVNWCCFHKQNEKLGMHSSSLQIGIALVASYLLLVQGFLGPCLVS